MTRIDSVAFGRNNPYDYIDEEKEYDDLGVEWLDTDEEAELASEDDPDQKIRATISDFVEFGIKIPSGGALSSFDFGQRRYLRPIYNTDAKRILLKAGRQVEKCVTENTLVSMGDGSFKRAGDIEVGDCVATMVGGVRTSVSNVVWKSDVYKKPCVRIHTRQRHSVDVALTHPMRAWDVWIPAGELHEGVRLAVVRRCGEFKNSSSASDARIKLTAFMIGDGSITKDNFGFTSLPGPALDDFLSSLQEIGDSALIYIKPGTKAVTPRIRSGVLKQWLREDGLLGKGSYDKFVPSWVFQLSREQTALFLNRLWSTDGHVKKVNRSQYNLVYCSMSQQLCLQVQALLWKFGVPSRIRENWPNYWKKRGIKKTAYILRVETRDGVSTFLSEIGALGKSEVVVPPEAVSNNNRDTYPIEINDQIRKIIDSRGDNERLGRFATNSLRTHGLRETLKYPPTREKLELYLSFFRSDDRYDQELVGALERHLNTDLYWDEIVETEDLGEKDCIDFEVDNTNNFVANGFVTHNSTCLGNKILAHMALIPFFRCLYVSPSNTQTKVFSRDRIKEPIDVSPYLQSYTNSILTANILEKKFNNGSQITMRFAFLNADRCRGVPADAVNIDEMQDIYLDNIPVIEECASHSDHKLFTYSGTPKSLDNAIEHYWIEYSTQNEWVIPCRRHGTPKRPDTWHWNILDEDNVGKKSLVCDRCGKEIDPKDPDATWVAQNPNPRVEKPFEGYRLPQLMVPWVEWADIRDKQTKYSRAKFHNEVLGLSYDSGTRPLTRNDMKKASWNALSMQHFKEVKKYCSTHPIFMGVDWGCHDDQTRILTERGFVYFKDLEDGDKVAQFDQESRTMSFVSPISTTEKDWDGEMLHWKRKSIDMMVTPDHRMLAKTECGSKWKVRDAVDLTQKSSAVEFVDRIVWEGERVETFTLPGIPGSAGYTKSEDLSISMDFWLEFLGYYLSEGGLCWNRREGREPRPSCIKMSQRETVNPKDAKKIGDVLARLPLNVSTFPNPKDGDLNWTIYGKQLWYWIQTKVGEHGNTKRIPREFLSLPTEQLWILFDAMVLGDGSKDKRDRNYNGSYSSTSHGLCEDVQELCIRLGLRSTLRLAKKAEGNKKTKWAVSWSKGRRIVQGNEGGTFTCNYPNRTERVHYKGKVYCCTVPTGFIVTERNGRIAYQGNSGENSFTVVTLAGYLPFAPDYFTYFYMKRFEGVESDPERQLEQIVRLAREFNVMTIGVDYGGGFWPNDRLVRIFGAEKVKKYQWVGNVKKKVAFDPKLGVPRFLCHRTEVMSDMFNAIKRQNVFRFPRWEEFEDPFAKDFLNIFSEYNERLRMNVYKHAPGSPDDSFHACLFGFLASFYYRTRPDVILPTKEIDSDQETEHDELDIN